MTSPQYTVGLETSGPVGSVAVLKGDELIGEREIGDSGRRHARTLISELDDLLRSLSIPPKTIDLVAVSIGPGSFTGLRVGVVAAKCWAFVTGCRLAAVGTFEAVATSLPVDRRTAWIIDDALRGDVFVQRFESANDLWQPVGAPELKPLDSWLRNTTSGDAVSGPGVIKWQDDLIDLDLVITDVSLCRPTASLVAICGQRNVKAGQFADPFTLAPLYIRRSAAEEKLDAETAAGPR